MLKIYGSKFCPDCVRCLSDLDQAGVAYEYLDFADSLSNLKVFLSLRDRETLFTEVKAEGKIGIPCIVRENDSVTLDWQEYM